MLALTSAASTSLVVSTPMRASVPARAEVPVMFGFLKELGLEKPDFLPDFGAKEAIEVNVKEPSAAIATAAKGMPALSPIFNVECELQAAAFNLGSYDEDAIQADIDSTIKSAPVVAYTYGLSPFSTEVVDLLESTGCKFENVELGAEWFALGPEASATRNELRKTYGQSSLPHVFIGGEWVGGLATGADGGVAGLIERDELIPKLRKARAL